MRILLPTGQSVVRKIWRCHGWCKPAILALAILATECRHLLTIHFGFQKITVAVPKSTVLNKSNEVSQRFSLGLTFFLDFIQPRYIIIFIMFSS